MSKKPWDILLVEDYEHKGEKRTKYHQVGVAFENDREGFTLNITPGLALMGRAIILPRKDKPASGEP